MPGTFVLHGKLHQKLLVEGHTTAKLPNSLSFPFPFPSSEVDNHLGTSPVCQSVTRKTGAVARVGNRGVSGAQVTKNSSRLELGTLQMVDPVPELPSCAESSAATLRIIWFCCRWRPVQSFQSHSVWLKNGILGTNSCSRMLLAHFGSLGMVEREHPVVPKYCWGAYNTPWFIETRSVQLQLSKFQSHVYSVSSTIPAVTAWIRNVQNSKESPGCKNLLCFKSGSANYYTITASLFKLIEEVTPFQEHFITYYEYAATKGFFSC